MAKGEIFKGLPPVAKAVIVIAGTGVAVIILYKGYKYFQNRKLLAGANQQMDQLKKEAQQQKVGPTLTPSQMTDIANQLFTAMNGFGHNEKAIYANIAKIKNDSDMIGVIQAYGIRKVSSGKYNPMPDFTGTLSQAFVERLASDERSAINTVLAKKGIKYRF